MYYSRKFQLEEILFFGRKSLHSIITNIGNKSFIKSQNCAFGR